MLSRNETFGALGALSLCKAKAPPSHWRFRVGQAIRPLPPDTRMAWLANCF